MEAGIHIPALSHYLHPCGGSREPTAFVGLHNSAELTHTEPGSERQSPKQEIKALEFCWNFSLYKMPFIGSRAYLALSKCFILFILLGSSPSNHILTLLMLSKDRSRFVGRKPCKTLDHLFKKKIATKSPFTYFTKTFSQLIRLLGQLKALQGIHT